MNPQPSSASADLTVVAQPNMASLKGEHTLGRVHPLAIVACEDPATVGHRRALVCARCGATNALAIWVQFMNPSGELQDTGTACVRCWVP